MTMNPPAPVPESETTAVDGTPITNLSDPDCPFCAIVSAYPPVSVFAPSSPTLDRQLDAHKLDPPALVVLSTPHVIAFFDVYPLTRGHVLICPRRHVEKVGDLTGNESAEIGRVLPLLSRALTSACMPDIPNRDVDYNIVQNNGPGAAQVVPHAHFHFMPRYPFDYTPPALPQTGANTQKAYDKNQIPEGMEATRILFGRGQRHYRDEDDAESLVRVMRERVREEWEKEFGKGKL